MARGSNGRRRHIMKFLKNITGRLSIFLTIFIGGFFASGLYAADADTDLMNRAKAVLGPLPLSMPSPDNPITPAKVKLGQALFFEPRISVDKTVSCAKCHPMSIYAADGLKKAVGNNCKPNPRNSPTIFNAAAQISAHWIGNRASVEDPERVFALRQGAQGHRLRDG